MTGAAPAEALRWAVKDSFIRYVRTVAGTCEATGEARLDADGVFTFPVIGSEREADSEVLAFGGGARFHAHGGFLDIEFGALELWLTPEGGALHVRTAANERVALATMEPAGSDGGDTLVPHLTDAGAAVFGNVYAVGTELAPLSVIALLD
ncbi:HtaA domain-containing protein [Streptomyces sp. NBC_01239]|uniref:HtaA domain-containing protein n=1 Tax=Streptomyces sp. NBC_01239 TaxID=2903792 RepID=UPI002254FD9F|nr:HtaA domain-containing protein [Streptomyces sp. NBC_01239]MCX4816327.1 HtaA domain-containing protein [Streptomyces sp. NBC_01239]